mgnify:CR=1 FL=1
MPETLLPVSVQFGLSTFAGSLAGYLIFFNRGWRWFSLEQALARGGAVAGYGMTLFCVVLALSAARQAPASLWPAALVALVGVSLAHAPFVMRRLFFAGKPLDETQLAVLLAGLSGAVLWAVTASAGL